MAASVLFLLAAAPLWGPKDLSADVVRRGYFERDEGGALGVALQAPERDMVPALDVADRLLRVPPGYVVALPLDSPITARAPGRPPWFAVGDAAAGSDGVIRVTDAATLRGTDLVPWRPGSGWAEERRALEDLGRACGLELRLEPSGAVQLGGCRAQVDGPRGFIVLAAGPDWLEVERQAGFGLRRTVVPPLAAGAAILSAIVAALLLWSLGAASALTTAASVACLALFSPVGGPLGLLAALAAGWIASLTKAARSRRERVGAGLLVPVLGLTALPAMWSEEPSGVVSDSAPCTLTGYSTAEGHGLRDDSPRPADRLRTGCAACADGTESLARGGERFDFVRDQLCGSTASLEGRTVVFVGGGNDDLLWGLQGGGAGSWLGGPLAQLRALTGALAGPEASSRFYERGAEATRARFEAQAAVLTEGLGCANARGARLVFVQDFLAPDLAGGRAEDRRWMAERRQELVRGAGAHFVDLADVYGERAGVWTFSDFIHLSPAAHDELVPAICAQIPGPRDAEQGPAAGDPEHIPGPPDAQRGRAAGDPEPH